MAPRFGDGGNIFRLTHLMENSRESIAEPNATAAGFSGRSFPVYPIRGHFGAEWRRLTVTSEDERRLNTLAVE